MATDTSTIGADPRDGLGHDVDPVTFEVIRHRLLAITDEQGATLAAISGSPHVVNANDFNVGLYLPDGSVAAMGRTILLHSASMALITRHVIEDCAEDPGIHPGDMFVVNNPWKGSIHAQDMGVVAPIFLDGELVAWAGAMCHMPDVGGSRPGSFCNDATECYQEGLQLTPTKLVEDGRIRTDVWNLIMAHTRAAPAVNLDLRGLIGANNTAVRAMTQLAQRYGVDTVKAVMSGLIDLSDRRLRNRLRELPDAVIHSTAYLDNDGGLDELYEVDLVLTKTADRLHFDYSGSSPQVEGYINCTSAGLMAGINAALLPTLAYDAPWNEGLFQPVEVHAPEGLICNAKRPAAVSGGALEAGWLVEMTAIEALSKLVACSDDLIGEGQAAPAGGPDQFVLSGCNAHGDPFTHVILDCLATGGGAYAHRDGVWTQGQHNIERQRISNAEDMELETPLLYLERRLVTDSGGAGEFRGGQSMGSTFLVHRGTALKAMCNGHGWEAPNSTGIFGGFPGTQNIRELVAGSDVLDQFAAGRHVADLEQIQGERPTMHGRQGAFSLRDGDVLSTIHQSGGGWGDPLARPAVAVAEDLKHGAVSPQAAVRLYGAVLTGDGRVDESATAARRDRLRDDRRSWPVTAPATPRPEGALDRVAPLGTALEVLRAADGTTYTACRCGSVLSRTTRPWRAHAGQHVITDVHEVSLATRLNASLEIRQYACPACGTLLTTDVARRGAPVAHDVEVSI
ncbi:hydantoinase B/oxoprolinase family protein [Nocardioides carbamazepini]|uniref:hydantoinase B/oxoprolinase family protein n=1 Tax=Nocardioides carbamazepini TaxID=2854259 RepID=UPI002149EEFB|nr:hydantoinase B/oxoprolinase family protein [Nocardioides carbamazepini]MCR1782699.1 hydantoinase B/oxoprolinase family protein [Nocardioides carbamazepini]